MEIKVENVDYFVNRYTDMQRKVVSNLNMTIYGNKITAIIGGPGSSKSTILNLLGGIIKPSCGSISICNGKTTMDIGSYKTRVGIVCQDLENLFFCDTVEKEIEFALRGLSFGDTPLKKRVSDSLKMVGLDDSYLKRNPKNLSSGEQKRLGLATVLAFNPKVIILDEVSLDLDSAGRKHLIKLIRMMKFRYKKTVIISSMDSDFVHAIADDIYVVSSGKVIFHGDKYQVFTNRELLSKCKIRTPKLIEFSNIVMQRKNVNIGYRDDINDLLKDIYRYVK